MRDLSESERAAWLRLAEAADRAAEATRRLEDETNKLTRAVKRDKRK